MTSEPKYHVTTRVGGRTITFRHRIDDPFIAHRVTIGWRDLLRGLLHSQLVVDVLVDGDRDIVNAVMSLSLNPASAVHVECSDQAAFAEYMERPEVREALAKAMRE